MVRPSLSLLVATVLLPACRAAPDEPGRATDFPDAARTVLSQPAPSMASSPALTAAKDDPGSVVPEPATDPPERTAQAPDPGGSASPTREPEGTPPVPTTASHPSVSEGERPFRFPRPAYVRGLYVNAWSAGARGRMTELLNLATRTEINAFVIDIKDASGYVSHATAVPLAREAGATEEIRIPNLPDLLARLDSAGIYPIARIVIVKDPLMSAARPDLAVQDTAGGVWIDGNGIAWLNPYNREVWDYHIAIAREVAALGFPEIQWDYVRFPDAPASDLGRAHFPGEAGRSKASAIRDFLAFGRNTLSPMDVLLTADVFGITTSSPHDVGIGQVWESFIDVVDVALPMVYPSHYYRGSFGFQAPNAHPYEVVRKALESAVRRSAMVEGAGATRPWLQDFSLGEPAYDVPEVRAQIQATYDAGIREWILWNAASRYTEGSLEPADGFQEEPVIRIANELVPVSRRFELIDLPNASERPPGGSSPR